MTIPVRCVYLSQSGRSLCSGRLVGNSPLGYFRVARDSKTTHENARKWITSFLRHQATDEDIGRAAQVAKANSAEYARANREDQIDCGFASPVNCPLVPFKPTEAHPATRLVPPFKEGENTGLIVFHGDDDTVHRTAVLRER
jgi:hypothetical protein